MRTILTMLLFAMASSISAATAENVLEWTGKDFRKFEVHFGEYIDRNFIIDEASVVSGKPQSAISGNVQQMLKETDDNPQVKKYVYVLHNTEIANIPYIILAKELLDAHNGLITGTIVDIFKVENLSKDQRVISNQCSLKSSAIVSFPSVVAMSTGSSSSVFIVDWKTLKIISSSIDSKIECREYEEVIGD